MDSFASMPVETVHIKDIQSKLRSKITVKVQQDREPPLFACGNEMTFKKIFKRSQLWSGCSKKKKKFHMNIHR